MFPIVISQAANKPEGLDKELPENYQKGAFVGKRKMISPQRWKYGGLMPL